MSAVQPIVSKLPPIAFSLLAFLAAACGSDAASPDGGDQGVRGQVLLGPTCPGPMTDASPCPDRPLAGVTIRVLQDGTPLDETATSDARGRFELSVPPGEYTLEAVVDPGGPGMFAKPVGVTVPSEGFVEVVVPVDTGIR